MALSFVGLIAAGTLLLCFPAATGDGRGTPLLDALFTATSATCVTGLIVRDTPVFFSRFGQLVILGLIQLGGLGIMTFSASLAVVFGRRLGAARRRVVADLIEESRNIDIGQTLRYIVLFTLTAEALGTLLLFMRWLPEYPNPWYALYVAGFHSVSAFCNAGFSLFPDSLVHYAADPAVNLVVIGLIVSGGLGFVVVHEMLNRETVRRGPVFSFRRLTVHSRMVLWTTGLLTLAGTVLFFFFEYDGVLAALPVPAKLVASVFQAVTPRTAGFNTVSMAGLKPVTLLLFLALMFIGASPGSTGGGIKTSTFAVLFMAVRSRIRGRQDVEVHGRVVPKDVVYRATSIAVTSVAIVAGFFILLLATETGAFQDVLFETTSAFGTVGLSTGLTGQLSPVGRVLVTLLMYIGRLGPLTLALAMRARVSRLPIEYPSSEVMVG
ncbi:MAG: Trk family potassium uptake protein [candidate division WOR-3 bacterium]|nr:MAG: Trk family potassium uptake protein [candidate division WOR-3 bacterium]